jgi:hypothetical protein
MALDIEKARAAGYSDEEIQAYLAETGEKPKETIWSRTKKNLGALAGSTARGALSVAQGVVSPFVDVGAAAMRLPWTLTGNEAPAGLREPTLGSGAIQRAKQSVSEATGYEPGAVNRMLETGLEFSGAGGAQTAAALKWAPKILAAARAGNKKAAVTNVLTEMAAKDPAAFAKAEVIMNAAQGGGVGAAREVFPDDQLTPQGRMYRDLLAGLVVGGVVAGGKGAVQYGKEHLSSEAQASRRLMTDVVGDPRQDPMFASTPQRPLGARSWLEFARAT